MFEKIGGRKFGLSIIGIVVLMLYVIICAHDHVLIEIAMPFCTAIAGVIASFCATNVANDYTAMRREKNNVAPTVIQ